MCSPYQTSGSEVLKSACGLELTWSPGGFLPLPLWGSPVLPDPEVASMLQTHER